jgi:2-oxoglutarate ferredoxin oxidoreductase subunit beta
LTKGQFSATADKGSKSKRGAINSDEPIDLCELALTLGATFVARGFSGDKDQLVPLIKAAVAHHGAAFIDVVSPCVAFNNHPGSTKSYDYVREHNEAVNFLDFISPRAPITTAYAPGEVRSIVLHDGGSIRLRKVGDDYDPANRAAALGYLEGRREAGEVVTGLLYLRADAADMHDMLDTVEAPLNALGDGDLVPGSAALAEVNASLR